MGDRFGDPIRRPAAHSNTHSNTHRPSSQPCEWKARSEGARVQGGATVDARIPTPCQGEGRGFESRRPLQRKSRSRTCEGLKSAPRGASRGAAHHICTTFAELFTPIAAGEPLFSRVRVAVPSWVGCVQQAAPRRPVGRRRSPTPHPNGAGPPTARRPTVPTSGVGSGRHTCQRGRR